MFLSLLVPLFEFVIRDRLGAEVRTAGATQQHQARQCCRCDHRRQRHGAGDGQLFRVGYHAANLSLNDFSVKCRWIEEDVP